MREKEGEVRELQGVVRLTLWHLAYLWRWVCKFCPQRARKLLEGFKKGSHTLRFTFYLPLDPHGEWITEVEKQGEESSLWVPR